MFNREINGFASISFVVHETGTFTNWQQSVWESLVAQAVKAYSFLGQQLKLQLAILCSMFIAKRNHALATLQSAQASSE